MLDTISSPPAEKIIMAYGDDMKEYLSVVKKLNNISTHVNQYQGCRTWFKDGVSIASEDMVYSKGAFTFRLKVKHV